MNKMDIVWMNPNEIIPYERNQKKHDERQIRNVANSIKRFGWKQPIVIDRKNVCVIGHARREAALMLGVDVPVLYADDLTEDEVRELRIADNKTNESPWDFDSLQEDIEELEFSGFDFDFEKISDIGSIDDLFMDAPQKDDEKKEIQCPHCKMWFTP